MLPTDYATTVIHANDPVREPYEQSGPTFVLGTHIAKLREAADAWRIHAGLDDIFTYGAQSGKIEDEHFTSIIDALNAARGELGLANFAYGNSVSTPAANLAVDDDHVQQLRDVMK